MFLKRRFYMALLFVILLMGSGYFYLPLFYAGQMALLLFIAVILADAHLLYHYRKRIEASRSCAVRFSNGDDNKVVIHLQNKYPFAVSLEIIDEIPVIFQERNISFRLTMPRNSERAITYTLRPTLRGTYPFGYIRVFVTDFFGLLSRRYTCGSPIDVKVYPSFLMLHHYELLAINNNLKEMGIKRIRKIGHQTEFEQIKEYVKDDDYRTINWKASARRHQLMVNVFRDERSQPIYNVIDKGRVMQQAFKKMTLLDYAINASLMLSYVAIHKEDKAGLVTFDSHFDSFVPASKQTGQLQTLLESLYNQQTTFGETDYSNLCIHLNKQLNRRSLLIVYTNFLNMTGLNRQLPYFRQLSRKHRLLIVFFEDTDLKAYIHETPVDNESYFQHVIADKFTYEKRLIVSTLQQNGIFALLTTPESLTVDVINKYLELKARQLI